MGYRSEVAYSIHFEDKATLNEFIALVMMKGGHEKEALSECEIERKQYGEHPEFWSVNFYCLGVKWYEDYPEVKAHTWLYQYAVERWGDKTAYHFIRIGEEYGDIEDESDGEFDNFIQDDFYPTQGMEIPFSHNYEPLGDKLSMVE